VKKAITYSDEKLLKNSLKIYKREKKEINDGLVLEHAVRLAKSKVGIFKYFQKNQEILLNFYKKKYIFLLTIF